MFTCFSAQVLALMVDLEDCIVSCRCSPVSVPQVLAMMVDLEEEDDWAFQDEVEDEDHDR